MRNGVPSGVFGDFGCELYGGSPYSKPNPGYLGADQHPVRLPLPSGRSRRARRLSEQRQHREFQPRPGRRHALQLRHQPHQVRGRRFHASPTSSAICTRTNSKAATSTARASTCSTNRSRSSAARSARNCASSRCPPPAAPSIGPGASTTATTTATSTSTPSPAPTAGRCSACPTAPSSPPRSATPRTSAMRVFGEVVWHAAPKLFADARRPLHA